MPSPTTFRKEPALLSDKLVIWGREGESPQAALPWRKPEASNLSLIPGHLFYHFIGFIYLFILQLALWLKLLKQLFAGSNFLCAVSWWPSDAHRAAAAMGAAPHCSARAGWRAAASQAIEVLWGLSSSGNRGCRSHTSHCTRRKKGSYSNELQQCETCHQNLLLKFRECWKIEWKEFTLKGNIPNSQHHCQLERLVTIRWARCLVQGGQSSVENSMENNA